MQAQGELKNLQAVIQKSCEIEKLLRDNGVHLTSKECDDHRSSIFAASAENTQHAIELLVDDDEPYGVDREYGYLLIMKHRTHEDLCLRLQSSGDGGAHMWCDFDCTKCEQTESLIWQLGKTMFTDILQSNKGRTLTQVEAFAAVSAIAKLFRSAD